MPNKITFNSYDDSYYVTSAGSIYSIYEYIKLSVFLDKESNKKTTDRLFNTSTVVT